MRCKNQVVHETTVLYRKGSPEDPMTDEQLRKKFDALTKGIIGERRVQVANVVSRLEDCKNLTELSRVLSSDGMNAD